MDWRIVAWIGAGSALGGVARYVLSEWLTRGAFPAGTLAVNLLGSFLLGVLLVQDPTGEWTTPGAYAGLGTGVMGGFTTMSAFSYETVALAGEGQGLLAALYVGLTIAGCLAGAWAGQLVG